MSGAPRYAPIEDEAIRDACGHRRVDRIRDLAREPGRSEIAIRRRWQRLCRGSGRDPASSGADPSSSTRTFSVAVSDGGAAVTSGRCVLLHASANP